MPAAADKFSMLAALKPARPMPARPAAIRTPGEEDTLSRILGAGVATNHFGEHLTIRNWFSTPEFADPSSTTLELLSRTRDESLSRRTRAALENPEKWLFLDTETTGLAGGTGTYAFLVGIAWWDAGGLQVEQFFMRDFTEEHSLLHELAARLAARPVLVTFNGKSFDWPLLENRFTMTRAIPVPRLAAHLDLLHPARALWKLRLGSVRLVELERHVVDAARLGWDRQDDVVAGLIPQHYFYYLRGGPAEALAAVVRHNQMDLRGLAALVGKIDALLASKDGRDVESLDLFGLSRYLQRRGESQRAHSACTQAIDLGLPREYDGQARHELALLVKRRGEHDKASALWHELVKDQRNGAHACEQLAVYYERKRKDFERALEFAKLGLAKVRRARALFLDRHGARGGLRTEQRLAARIARLQARIELKIEMRPTLLLKNRSPVSAARKLPA